MKQAILNSWQKIGTLSIINDAYILVRGGIIIIRHRITQVAIKNCLPFSKYITKVDGATIHGTEDLYLVMPMYSLLEYSLNYSDTTVLYDFIPKMTQLVLILILGTIMLSILSIIKLNYLRFHWLIAKQN